MMVDTKKIGYSDSSEPVDEEVAEPESCDLPQINYSDLVMEKEGRLGRGSFGTVLRARWRGNEVAVKILEGAGEQNGFYQEISMLKRVNHENIIQLYAYGTDFNVFLVMELAPGGSLHSVLHSQPRAIYTAGHAMNWAFLCSRAVAYLHSLPLMHRDLKPANMLIYDEGRSLKICDFGTACEPKTYMTNTKGSAAFMAPEVFVGEKYNSKCDVYSWAIMLWEVLTRRKPFENYGTNTFAVMWAVATGNRRPPLIQNCPKPVDVLLQRCWEHDSTKRPPMSEVAKIMEYLLEFFEGSDQPIIMPVKSATTTDNTNFSLEELEQEQDGTEYTETPTIGYSDTRYSATLLGDVVPEPQPSIQLQEVEITEDDCESLNKPGTSRSFAALKSAPASLHASRDDFNKFFFGNNVDPTQQLKYFEPAKAAHKRRSTTDSRKSAEDNHVKTFFEINSEKPGSFKKTHRRNCSWDPQFLPVNENASAGVAVAPVSEMGSKRPNPQQKKSESFLKPSSSIIVPLPVPSTSPRVPRQKMSLPFDVLERSEASVEVDRSLMTSSQETSMTVGSLTAAVPSYLCLNTELQPIPPDPNYDDSLHIYNKHCSVAADLIRVKEEIKLLKDKKQKLTFEAEESVREGNQSIKRQDELTMLADHKKSLLELNAELKIRLESYRLQQNHCAN